MILQVYGKKMTKKVHEALQPRSSCSGCQFLSKCQGGCHLEHFFDSNAIKTNSFC